VHNRNRSVLRLFVQSFAHSAQGHLHGQTYSMVCDRDLLQFIMLLVPVELSGRRREAKDGSSERWYEVWRIQESLGGYDHR
jgi:hypothetical protein